LACQSNKGYDSVGQNSSKYAETKKYIIIVLTNGSNIDASHATPSRYDIGRIIREAIYNQNNNAITITNTVSARSNQFM
jgi:hypothetical protein